MRSSRTHGIAGRFRAAFWSSPVRTPPYYPDAVTLRPNITVEHLLSVIDVGEGCTVKDSFARLDLGAAALRPLFRAEWVARQHLLVVVATRMSLSFPILLSAVPLWSVDWSRHANQRALSAIRSDSPDDAAERVTPEVCWFSDGGISSNFPVTSSTRRFRAGRRSRSTCAGSIPTIPSSPTRARTSICRS